jgi:hypothetical protein
MVGFLFSVRRSLGFTVGGEGIDFVCCVLGSKVWGLLFYVWFLSFYCSLLKHFLRVGSVLFIVAHTIRQPVDAAWESFPGELAESIKGTRSVSTRF